MADLISRNALLVVSIINSNIFIGESDLDTRVVNFKANRPATSGENEQHGDEDDLTVDQILQCGGGWS